MFSSVLIEFLLWLFNIYIIIQIINIAYIIVQKYIDLQCKFDNYHKDIVLLHFEFFV